MYRPATLRHDLPPLPRETGAEAAAASALPAEPSPLETPSLAPPSIPRCSQRGSNAQNVVNAVEEDAARGRPSHAPFGSRRMQTLPLLRSRLPAMGAQDQKTKESHNQHQRDKGSALPRLRFAPASSAFHSSVAPCKSGARRAPRAPARPAREREILRGKRTGTLSRAPHPPQQGSPGTRERGRGEEDDDIAIMTLYAPPGPLRSRRNALKAPRPPARVRRRSPPQTRCPCRLSERSASLCSLAVWCACSMRGLPGFSRDQASAPCVRSLGACRLPPAIHGQPFLFNRLTCPSINGLIEPVFIPTIFETRDGKAGASWTTPISMKPAWIPAFLFKSGRGLRDC